MIELNNMKKKSINQHEKKLNKDLEQNSIYAE